MSPPSLLTLIISYLMALLAMAFYTLLERKLLGYFQLRKGPNKVLLAGLPQPMADALKLFLKENAPPTSANILPFLAAPAMGLFLALALWALYPLTNPSFFIPLGVLFFLCLSSMNTYVTLAAGWFSNSKYALLGSIRGVAQTISYEVSMALILITPLMLHSSFDFHMILTTSYTPKVLPLFPLTTIWLISILAETHRTPFDFAEGESELVSGFNVEYSATSFALIFMAEYANILLMCLLTSSIFFIPPLSPLPSAILQNLTTLALATLFIWVRATLPRLRYDLLMSLTWKLLLPLALGFLMVVFSLSAAIYS